MCGFLSCLRDVFLFWLCVCFFCVLSLSVLCGYPLVSSCCTRFPIFSLVPFARRCVCVFVSWDLVLGLAGIPCDVPAVTRRYDVCVSLLLAFFRFSVPLLLLLSPPSTSSLLPLFLCWLLASEITQC